MKNSKKNMGIQADMYLRKLLITLAIAALSACNAGNSGGKAETHAEVDDDPSFEIDPNTEALIAGGSYVLGCDLSEDPYCSADEMPLHTVHVDRFAMDRYETMVAEYRACVAAGACAAPTSLGDGCNYPLADREDHPMNCIEWENARNYCAWVGKRLPTEAEWEIAARGAEGRLYPWGWDDLTDDHAVYDSNGITGPLGSSQPVGSRPLGDTPDGLHDMAGNIDEWVQDWYDEAYYASMAEFINPQGPATGDKRVVRGSGWDAWKDPWNPAEQLRSASREAEEPIEEWPNQAWRDIGFRCARSL